MRLAEMNRTQLRERAAWLRAHAEEIGSQGDEAADHAGNLIDEADSIDEELSRGAPDDGDDFEFSYGSDASGEACLSPGYGQA